MIDPNEIAEKLFEVQHAQQFNDIKVATQGSVPLRAQVYATSRIICLEHHGEECNCICSDANCLDRLVVKNRVVPISKRKRKDNAQTDAKKRKVVATGIKSVEQRAETVVPAAAEETGLDDDDNDDDAQDTDHVEGCMPFEQQVFVPAMRPARASSNLYYCCYILQSVAKPVRTYCGITNNRMRRIRQHNGEIKGGAKQTRSDRPWRMIAFLNGFDTINEAQRFEWSMHHPRVRRLRKPYNGVQGRLNCMKQLLLEHDAWMGRFTDEPIQLILDNVVLTGTHREYKHFLLNLDDDCEIQYSPAQLRLYHDESGENCLAKWSLCKLESRVCVNG